jgi:hypothetical protein
LSRSDRGSGSGIRDLPCHPAGQPAPPYDGVVTFMAGCGLNQYFPLHFSTGYFFLFFAIFFSMHEDRSSPSVWQRLRV